MTEFYFTGGPGCVLFKNVAMQPEGTVVHCQLDILKDYVALWKDVRRADVYIGEYGLAPEQMNDVMVQLFHHIYLANCQPGPSKLIDCSVSNLLAYETVSKYYSGCEWAGLMISPWLFLQLVLKQNPGASNERVQEIAKEWVSLVVNTLEVERDQKTKGKEFPLVRVEELLCKEGVQLKGLFSLENDLHLNTIASDVVLTKQQTQILGRETAFLARKMGYEGLQE